MCLFLFGFTAYAEEDFVKRAVMKIQTTHRYPDPFSPWNKSSPTESSGTGFLIESDRILTNAHVVFYASQIYVTPNQSDEKLEASVEAISYGLDLAVLKLQNAESIRGTRPLTLDTELTPLRTDVSVYGFPIGGNQISITKGIVSRIEYAEIHANQLGLRTQIDAATNPGNSGGPAISNGKVVGVAFSGIRHADNIGYLIHSTEVIGFLKDIEDGTCDGKPNFWDQFQPVENPALRSKLQLPKGMGGVMISSVRGLTEESPLVQGDVITKIGPHALDWQGNVKVNDLTLSFLYYVPLLAENGSVPMTLWREGREIELQCPTPNKVRLLVPDMEGDYPKYFIFGPLVFEAATAQVVESLISDKDWLLYLAMRQSPLLSSLSKPSTPQLEEIVFIPAPLFSHRSTKGYRPIQLLVVRAINDVKIRSLAHLVEILRDCQDEFLEIQFADYDSERLIFNRQELADATDEVLADNGVRKQCSDVLLPVWNQGTPKE
jgi:S1-C subfamily serine protease